MNVLASSLALLNRIETYSFSSLSELAYSKIVSISAEDIFSFSTSCGWVSENENALILTKHGTGLLRLQAQGLLINLKRQMLADYVLKTAPIWSNRIPYGRREATIFMSKDEKACFADAGLLSDHLDTGIITCGTQLPPKSEHRINRQKTKQDGSANGILSNTKEIVQTLSLYGCLLTAIWRDMILNHA